MYASDGPPGRPTLLGIPFDGASSFMAGAAGAPPRLRAALRDPASNSWTEALVDIGAPGAWADAGDLSSDALAADRNGTITGAVADIYAEGGRPMVLGGDHAITWPVLRAVRAACEGPLAVLHLDAHNDLYESFEGDRMSHACPFARIMEEGLADQLVQVGIRAMTRHQRDQAERYGVDVIDMRRWARGDRPALRHPTYISLDIDVLDPAHAPGVSHREPGGLTVREVLGLVQDVGQRIVGADLVEYNPRRDLGDVTASVGGKLLKELLGAMLVSR